MTAQRLRLRRPSTWLPRARMLWAGSLRFRTTAITLFATALAITVACVSMALAIHNELFNSRVNQVLEQAERGISVAQGAIDDADYATDAVELQQTLVEARESLRAQAGTNIIAYNRISEEYSQIAPPDTGFLVENADDLVSDGLRKRVQSSDEAQFWQSVSLQNDASSAPVPAVVVGHQLNVQAAGAYEVYLVYSLEDADETLRFVQTTLWITGGGLVVLVVLILWFVLRAITLPIVETSQTSARFAGGDLDVRVRVHGEDEIATLGRSFNAMADSIESQIKELAELSLVQQRFVSDVSHELRTPLTTIRLASEMINDRRDALDESTGRAAELLHAQVARFEELLGDLLEISRYDAGSVQLELEPTGLAALAEDVASSMAQVAEQHGSELRVTAPGGYTPIDVDPRRIRRVLRNLIGNAIEHGEGRPIVITVDSDAQAAAIGVRDFGIGMRQDDVERVFDRFWRADPSRKRTLGGTGLGLSIAQGDARLHGGTLQVWSRPGEGSHFVLTIPRSPDGGDVRSPIVLEPIGDQASLGATQPIRIVVDDDDTRTTEPEEEA